MALVGPMIFLIGSVLIYLLVEGILNGALISRSSEVEFEANPLLFVVVASIYAIAGVANIGIGVLLTKDALQKSDRER